MTRRATAKHRDVKPDNTTDRDGIAITWHEERDSRRLRRIGEILADILDNPSTPGERGQP